MPTNGRLHRLPMVWIKSFLISCSIFVIVFTGHSIGSVTKRIAAAKKDVDSSSRFKDWIQFDDIITKIELEESNISRISKKKGVHGSFSPLTAKLGSSLTSPGSSRKLGVHQEFKVEDDRLANHAFHREGTIAAGRQVTDRRSPSDPAISKATEKRRATRSRPVLGHSAYGVGANNNDSSSQSNDDQCEYTIVTVTGNQDGAGTGSGISLGLSNADGDQVLLRWLENGLKKFERGHTDTFVLDKYPCIKNICRITLHTDDYGDFSEWFVVRVTIFVSKMIPANRHPLLQQQKDWEFEEWLPKIDEAHELFTVRDDCPNS